MVFNTKAWYVIAFEEISDCSTTPKFFCVYTFRYIGYIYFYKLLAIPFFAFYPRLSLSHNSIIRKHPKFNIFAFIYQSVIRINGSFQLDRLFSFQFILIFLVIFLRFFFVLHAFYVIFGRGSPMDKWSVLFVQVCACVCENKVYKEVNICYMFSCMRFRLLFLISLNFYFMPFMRIYLVYIQCIYKSSEIDISRVNNKHKKNREAAKTIAAHYCYYYFSKKRHNKKNDTTGSVTKREIEKATER